MKVPDKLKDHMIDFKDKWIKAGIAYVGEGHLAVPTFGVLKKSSGI